MSERKSIHGEWSSGMAFFLAATGSAIGLGNIWRFPYLAGENGGGAFILVYLACIVLIALPILIAEITLGRRGRESPLNTFRRLALDEGRSRAWAGVGFIGMLSGIIILSFYSVVAGWSLEYIWLSLRGAYQGASADRTDQLFSMLTSSPWQQMFWYTLFLALTLIIVARGVRKGLERAVWIMVPLLFVLLAVLVAYALVVGDAHAAIVYLYSVDFSRLSGHAVLLAMGHSFFTLSLGIGAMIVYGAYMPNRLSIMRAAISVAVADTVVAVLAGLAIFPLLFARHLPVAQGPKLIFASLPAAFGSLPFGFLFGAAFFALLTLAAWTSAISIIEPVVSWLVELGWSRPRSVLAVGSVVWMSSMLIDFSLNVWSGITWQGRTLFDLFNFVSSDIMLPLGGLLIALFAGWVISERSLRQELRMNRGALRLWLWVLRYVTPVGVLLIFLNALGLIRGAL
ncbi:sodium-dependent transporter [Acidihalobacter ferrooxydans]|uniref:Transporter n=1 Tax=Acidihalobacter ferrooxydans TaxID=1765967 RepID=A0A1P8UEJ3_9GAMM|nr:sodium-dependent transporter [Acidihalobacter ferrooxydans]APZ42226.1 sodium-dependent transporter [Acidihalobacter ferrooxydans]